jgi:integrase
MADLRYLKQRRQGWYFRIAVPSDLQDRIRPGRPMREIVETLGTTDLRKAQSDRWARREHWERHFKRLRGEPDDVPIKPPREVYEETLKAARVDKVDAHGREEWESDLDRHLDAVLGEAMARQGVSDTTELDDLPPDLQARLDALQDYRREALGKKVARRSIYSTTVREAADGFLREAGKTAMKQTIGQYEAVLRLFTDFTNNKPMGEVKRRDVALFLDEVEQLHPHWGRSPKTKERSFADIVETFRSSDETVGLSNRTLNRYLTAVSGAWKWAKLRGEAEGENPTADLFRPTSGKHSEPYQPYPPELLARLFEEPKPDNPLMWELPYVALFTGMRLNEICSLDWSDVQEDDGVVFFDVTVSKSEAGVRRVPVHSRLGWLMERRREKGAIWPELKAGGPDKKRSWYFTKRFGVFRRGRGIVGAGLKFHSFRKNTVQCFERARVPQNEAAEIVGHEKVGITYSVYNPQGMTMRQRLEVVEKIGYPVLGDFIPA